MLKRQAGNLVYYRLTHRITDKPLWDVLGSLQSFMCVNPITGNVDEYSSTLLRQARRSHQSFQLDLHDSAIFERVISADGWVITDGTTRPEDIARCADVIETKYAEYYSLYTHYLALIESDVVLESENIDELITLSGELSSAITDYQGQYRNCSNQEKELRSQERQYVEGISAELTAMYPRSLLPLEPRASLATIDVALSVLKRLDPTFNCINAVENGITLSLPNELTISVKDGAYSVVDPHGTLTQFITGNISVPTAATSGPRLLRRQGALSTNHLLTDK